MALAARLRAKIGRAGRQLGWAVGDQALSSLSNFALGIVVARTVSARDFGAFGLMYAVYALALGVTRALSSEPVLVRFSAVDRGSWERGASWATGVGLLTGIVGGAGCLGAGLAIGGAAGAPFIALGLMLPGLLLQDGWRYCFVANGQSRLAFLIDLVWVGVMAATFAGLISMGRASVESLVFAWGASATVASLIALCIDRILPDPRKAILWLAEQRDLAFRYVAEFVAANGALQCNMFLVAAVAGLASVGSLRAGLIMFGPVIVIFQGLLLAFVPEGVRILGQSKAALRHALGLVAIALVACALVWGAAFEVLPARLGRSILGPSWGGAHALALPLTIMVATTGAQLAAVIGLRAMAAARQSLTARLIEAGLTLTGGLTGAIAGGAVGAAWGMAAAYLFEVGVWWWQFLKTLHAYTGAGVSEATVRPAEVATTRRWYGEGPA
jgi:O-antigen/teichoic acid export membrane protein